MCNCDIYEVCDECAPRLSHTWDRRRGDALEAALKEIAITYDQTPQTPAKLSAALYAVSRLAATTLRKFEKQ